MPDEAENATDRLAGSPLARVPIEVTVSVGHARPLVKDLVELAEGAELKLDRRIDDPVELFVGDKMIARGELMELDGDEAGQLGVRLIEVAEPGRGL